MSGHSSAMIPISYAGTAANLPIQYTPKNISNDPFALINTHLPYTNGYLPEKNLRERGKKREVDAVKHRSMIGR
jgi:hypothetical protein